MGQISQQGLLEAVQVNIDVGADGLEGSLLHPGDLPSDCKRPGVTFAQMVRIARRGAMYYY